MELTLTDEEIKQEIKNHFLKIAEDFIELQIPNWYSTFDNFKKELNTRLLVQPDQKKAIQDEIDENLF